MRRRDDAATGEGGRTLVAVEAPSECPSCGRVTQFIRDPGGRWVLCVRCGRSIDIVAPSPAG